MTVLIDDLRVADSYEAARLQALRSTGLLDTPAEVEFNELVELGAAICRTPLAAMTLLDERREWIKASVGIPAMDVPREVAFCEHTVRETGPLIVEDARLDARFASNPAVVRPGGLRFYAGFPLQSPDGYPLGALCVADVQPRLLTEQQVRALTVLAKQVMTRIELRVRERELRELLAEKERIAAGLAEYQTQLEAANDKLRSLVVTDALTGLKNRRAFEERLQFELGMARRKERDLAVALLDVDDFKCINDSHGHQVGDEVLQEIGAVLQAAVRDTDIAARYGGEEFAVLLPESSDCAAMHWCERLRKTIADHPWRHRPITVSIGVASRTEGYTRPEEIMAAADRALYRAKALGKDRAISSRGSDLG